MGAPMTGAAADTVPVRGFVALNQPVAVYNNWSAYDELSDNVVLTEELAMKQLQEILRLRRAGVRIDYYMMDAFWYAPKGGYREFRRPHWPNGPDRWLLAFDSLYCGDPRPADVPAMNFWRAQDLYTDHMIRYYEANGVPLERIDNTGFMVGTTGTCYGRRTAAWKGMLLLEHARGGWMNVYYGNLELIDTQKAKWFAKLQRVYFTLQSFGHTYTFGGLPGKEEPYGFCSLDAGGSLYTMVNPSQSMRTVQLPRVLRLQGTLARGRVQFRDAGFVPRLAADEITLGPEQIAVVGYGEYAKAKHDLGMEEDVVIPQSIRRLEVAFRDDGTNTVAASMTAPDQGDVRIVLRWFAEGKPWRVSGGAAPNGTSLGKIARIEVAQDGRPIPLRSDYDKPIWSGLSWAVGEVKAQDLKPGVAIAVRCLLGRAEPAQLKAEVYEVNYRGAH